MTHTRNNEGVCSAFTTVKLNGSIIEEVQVQGGCDGNLKGLCALLRGQEAGEAIARLEGLQCGPKITSCPNEIAKCLKEALAMRQEAS